jgi:hypothetical protein
VILLSDIYATAGYAHGRSAGGLLQTLMGTGASEILPDLGVLHRACIWENVLLKAQAPEKESEPEGNSILSSLQPSGLPSSSDPTIAANGANTSSTTVTPTEVPGQEGPHESDPREENAKAFRHLANQIPGALSPFFQCTAFFATELTDILNSKFPHSHCEIILNPAQSRRSAKTTDLRLSIQGRRCVAQALRTYAVW